MAIFGVEVEKSEEADIFFFESNVRLQDENLVRNPFKGEIKKLGTMFVIDIKPIYINFTPIVWGLAIATFLIFGYRWVQIGLVAIGCLCIFWSKYFFYIMMRLGLKKYGYKGKVKLISSKEVIRRGVLKSGKRKY